MLVENHTQKNDQVVGTGKGTPRSIFFLGRLDASMSVEASLVLPLFLFFFLHLTSAIEMIRLHGNVQLALWDVGNQISVYGQVLSGDPKRAFREYLGDAYLDHAPVVDGVDGFHLVCRKGLTDPDTFELVIRYEVRPLIPLVGFSNFELVNRYYGHRWKGYRLSGEESTAIDYVYVAEHGSVYHETIACTHLSLHVQETRLGTVPQQRNAYGGKYHPCEICADALDDNPDIWPDEQPVWITSEGNRIHLRETCSGLKRTVYAIPRAESGKYRPCSRCAGNIYE